MKHILCTPLIVLVSSGCATIAPTPAHVNFSVADSRILAITSVSAQDRGSSTRIVGRVARRSVNSGIIGGHLHIEAWGGGKQLARKDTHWHLLPKRRAGSTSFIAELPVHLQNIEEIRVSHAPTTFPCRNDNPIDYGNIMYSKAGART